MHSPIEIPGHEFFEKIGEGGMATVWKARQDKLDRIVAVKILRERIEPGSQSYESFLYEARAAANMLHPSIVQVIDAGEVDGYAYYIMEYVPGGTLADHVTRSGAIPEPDVLKIAKDVAEALHYGWEDHHTIHCDIKPDNLLQHRNGRIKVADLGLAQVMGDGFQVEDGMTIGTPNYFSPEQALVLDNIDCRSDIYALGATLYHLATGVLPFKGLPPVDVAEQQVHGSLTDPIELNPRLSPSMCYLLEKMMAKKPEYRHRNWQEVLTDISRLQEGNQMVQPLPAMGLSTIERSTKRPAQRTQAKRRSGSRSRGRSPRNPQVQGRSKRTSAGSIQRKQRTPGGGETNRVANQAEPAQQRPVKASFAPNTYVWPIAILLALLAIALYTRTFAKF